MMMFGLVRYRLASFRFWNGVHWVFLGLMIPSALIPMFLAGDPLEAPKRIVVLTGLEQAITGDISQLFAYLGMTLLPWFIGALVCMYIAEIFAGIAYRRYNSTKCINRACGYDLCGCETIHYGAGMKYVHCPECGARQEAERLLCTRQS